MDEQTLSSYARMIDMLDGTSTLDNRYSGYAMTYDSRIVSVVITYPGDQPDDYERPIIHVATTGAVWGFDLWPMGAPSRSRSRPRCFGWYMNHRLGRRGAWRYMSQDLSHYDELTCLCGFCLNDDYESARGRIGAHATPQPDPVPEYPFDHYDEEPW